MELILGDCLKELKQLEDNSVDAIVTDPPYGLSFMGKRWDYDVPSVDIWKECLRVLKPGGYLLSFAGTRTQHRMAVNIEDAGFEIRDMIFWTYASGFPKSLNVWKQLKKRCTCGNMEAYEQDRNVQWVSNKQEAEQTIGESGGSSSPRPQSQQQQYREPCAFCKQYGTQAMGALGLGSALKPACEPITVARKPISEKNLADNHLKWGVGGINIDGCRVDFVSEEDKKESTTKNQHEDFGTKPMTNNNVYGDYSMIQPKNFNPTGRFPANLIHDGSDEVVGLFPQTKSGKMGKQHTRHTDGSPNGIYGKFDINHELGETYGDSGSASRFFKACNYSLKHDTMSIWKTIFVDTVERLLRITQATKEGIAPLNAEDLQEEQNDQLVKSAVSHADTIEILTALVLVRIKSLASSPEGLLAIQDSIGNCKECTQLLNLVLCVVKEGNTDITQITTNLWKSFGSVNPVITNSTQETEKLEPKRFAYIPKASKRERNIGCEGLEKGCTHPTVKPVALMEYLVKLVSREGQVILDPFMGSGTTGMACKKLDREFIGIEMMPEYMEIAKARIEGVKKEEQLGLI